MGFREIGQQPARRPGRQGPAIAAHPFERSQPEAIEQPLPCFRQPKPRLGPQGIAKLAG